MEDFKQRKTHHIRDNITRKYHFMTENDGEDNSVLAVVRAIIAR